MSVVSRTSIDRRRHHDNAIISKNEKKGKISQTSGIHYHLTMVLIIRGTIRFFNQMHGAKFPNCLNNLNVVKAKAKQIIWKMDP